MGVDLAMFVSVQNFFDYMFVTREVVSSLTLCDYGHSFATVAVSLELFLGKFGFAASTVR